MPKVWLTIPAARKEADSTLHLWREKGYAIALFTDGPSDLACDLSVIGTRGYPGYAVATNEVIRRVLAQDSEAQFCVCGGDDVEPDAAHMPEELASQLDSHFNGTFSVTQFCGDRWGESPSHPDPKMRSAYIDRIAGSPWIGREFARRMYNGNGPYHPDYRHMYCDEELFEVAKSMGVLWQRRELIHLHRHWARKPGTMMNECPEFLKQANSEAGWAEARMLFESRKALGFPGHGPCL